MRRTHTGGLLFFMCAALLAASLPARHARAQDGAGASPPPENAEAAWGARKLDEFKRARGCEHGARLDNLGIELQNNQELTGYVIAYGPSGKGGGTADYRLLVTTNYLVNARGIAPERIKTINGGAYSAKDETMVELWVVPHGAVPPEPRKFENDAATFQGLYSDYETGDLYGMLGESLGPPNPDSTLAGFAEVLRLQPSARAYVVAFTGEEESFGAWQRAADREVEQLKTYGVGADRVSVIFGGRDKGLRLQLWALPPDAPPPAAEAEREKRPEKATRIGPYDAMLLKFPDEARTLFKAFAAPLKADEEMTAALTVYLPSPRETWPEGFGDDPDEPPIADLVRLVEKWKGDLKKEYGVGAHRLVVTIVPHEGEDWDTGSVVAWLVPPGVAPPGPDAEKEEAEAEEEEEAEPAEGEDAEPVAEEQGEAPPTNS
jgi:hypothetical protein